MKAHITLITRSLVTVLLLCLQVFLIAFLLSRIVNFLPVITIASYLLSTFIVILLIRKGESSAYKIRWILVIMLLPISGGILYLLFGSDRLERRMNRRLKNEHKVTKELLRDIGITQTKDSRVSGLLNYIRNTSGYPAYENTELNYYPTGESMFEALLAELLNAKEYIFLHYFMINDGKMWQKIVDVLINKANEDVEVRLVFDDFGSYTLFSSSYLAHLRSKNIKILRFNPLLSFFSMFMNHRDHRKITVIDGRTAFTGGINIVDRSINQDSRYFGDYKDTAIKARGEAVWSFTLMVIETWNAFCRPDERINDCTVYKKTWEETPAGTGLVLPYNDSPLDDWRISESIYMDLINRANKYVYIFTPFLIIGGKITNALQMAAKRGVDVRIITPGADKKVVTQRLTRSNYDSLLDAGVRIFEYQSGYFHAKNFVCDDDFAVIGTINLDYRSLYLHFENAVILYKTDAVAEIKQDADSTLKESREVQRSCKNEVQRSCKKKAFWNELIDAVLNLFAPLM